MTWGVGSGRCGTKSLAAHLGIEHEPFGYHPPEKRVSVAVEFGTEGVDLQYAFHLDDIQKLDPEAELAWVVRNPFMTIASYLAGNPTMKLTAAISRWLNTNTLILASSLPKTIYRCEDLPVHANKHDASPHWRFKPAESAWIGNACHPLYREILDLIDAAQRASGIA